ncbi:MAG: RNA 3'-terminal phosphate cyclase [Myxococcales bacterium]|nr:RNA 3'-terminal phosphate cyclase [Myxococcales bacterium]
MIEIDGSFGEGGGQILRSALALAAISGEPTRIFNIRAARAKPGLARQHLTAVRAVASISDAELEGDALRSREVTLRPRRVRGGTHQLNIGTAGSTCLVLQTVLWPLLVAADAPARVVLEGGTHNKMAPPWDFIEGTFLPLVRRMGGRVTARLERAGFYPAGGGRIVVEIEPLAAGEKLDALELERREGQLELSARATLAKLPAHIAERELDVLGKAFGLGNADCLVQQLQGTAGPGNVCTLVARCENICEVFTGFGERGLPAEVVARRCADEARAYLATDAPVGPHLADQLIIPCALADGASSLRCSEATLHTTTNVEVVARFTGRRAQIEPAGDGGVVRLRF